MPGRSLGIPGTAGSQSAEPFLRRSLLHSHEGALVEPSIRAGGPQPAGPALALGSGWLTPAPPCCQH